MYRDIYVGVTCGQLDTRLFLNMFHPYPCPHTFFTSQSSLHFLKCIYIFLMCFVHRHRKTEQVGRGRHDSTVGVWGHRIHEKIFSIIVSHGQCTTHATLAEQTTFWLCWRRVRWIFATPLGWKERNRSSFSAALWCSDVGSVSTSIAAALAGKIH